MKKFKMNKTSAIVSLVLSLAVVIFLGYLIIYGVAGYGQAKSIKKGLDLEGGVSITYQVSDKNAKWDKTDLNDTRNKLEKRIHSFSTEANAYLEGEDRITVDIPGEKNADKVLEELGKPGSLYFCTKAESDPTEEQIANKEYVQVSGDKSGYDGYYKIWVTGEQIQDAKGQASADQQTGATEYVVSLVFNSDGAKAFGDMTSQYVGQQTYIIYDGKVLSAPRVNEAITGGKAQIDGQKDLEEAEMLASNIRIGALTLELDEISHKVESAQLGSDALSKSLKAGFIGFLIIIIFLLIVYRIPGLAAGLALVSYVEMILLALNGFDLTLTLPGIAGIILNIGMAVDANVIIYARIREEIAAGKTVKSAIEIGFKKAASAIVDGNITTLIAALILLWRGSGTVQGFAQTLAIGILIQLFTSLVISRGFVWMLYYMGFDRAVFYGKEVARKTINFVQKKVVFFSISIACIVIGLGAIVFNTAKGETFNYSIEFKSGSAITVQFDKDYSMDDFNDKIKPDIEKIVGSSDVQGQKDTATKGLFTIKTKRLEGKKFDEFRELLVSKYQAQDKDDNFANTMISSTVSKEMRRDAVIATIIATIFMLIYIWVRFKNIHFAVAAVIALAHDVLIVVGFYGLARVTVGTTFIACLLTIVGYSINATIVIFDRIRENKAIMKRKDTMIDVVNNSITQTLTRSIYTTFTTFIMVFMIYIMGVSSIREFTLPLMVGLIAGAYSSVFVTGALWYTLRGKKYDANVAK